MMRSGAHLHMHPMACECRGRRGMLRRGVGSASPWSGQRGIVPSFAYATTTHARDLQDFSISPSLGNPPKLILEPL